MICSFAPSRGTLDPRLQEYIQRVHTIAALPLSDSEKLRRVETAALEFAAVAPVIRAEDRRYPAQGYGRNLLYRDAREGFVVIAMVWPPGTGSAPHDHGTWGTVAVLEGNVLVTNYDREDDASEPLHAHLRALRTIRARPGDVATVLPPHEDFHSVVNPSNDQFALTIHTYGREPSSSNVVDLRTGVVRASRLEYHNG